MSKAIVRAAVLFLTLFVAGQAHPESMRDRLRDGSLVAVPTIRDGQMAVELLEREVARARLADRVRSRLLTQEAAARLWQSYVDFSSAAADMLPGATRSTASDAEWDAELIAWETTPEQKRIHMRTGERFNFFCPPDGRPGRLFGTGIHDAGSSICTAGVHAGVITLRSGGPVTIELRGHQGSYEGSTRNGVTSQSYGSWVGQNFVVVPSLGASRRAAAPAPRPRPALVPSDAQRITWSTTPEELRIHMRLQERFRFACPPGGEAGRLFGTGIHDAGSSICTAAVHAGVIDMRNGGVVTIEIRGHQASYEGSSRNGVTSQSYGSWVGQNFVVVE